MAVDNNSFECCNVQVKVITNKIGLPHEEGPSLISHWSHHPPYHTQPLMLLTIFTANLDVVKVETTAMKQVGPPRELFVIIKTSLTGP